MATRAQPDTTQPAAVPTWVFGYGSLIWRVDFPWLERRKAALAGWSRRFWQGSHDHRGVAAAPGRVVTLIEAPGETCVGVAYRVAASVLDGLDHREKNGYERQAVALMLDEATTLAPNEGRSASAAPEGTATEVQGIVYVAPPGNHAFLGDAPLEHMAWHIRKSAGPSGRNLDYLLELARALRELDAEDAHVLALEAAVLGRRPGAQEATASRLGEEPSGAD